MWVPDHTDSSMGWNIAHMEHMSALKNELLKYDADDSLDPAVIARDMTRYAAQQRLAKPSGVKETIEVRELFNGKLEDPLRSMSSDVASVSVASWARTDPGLPLLRRGPKRTWGTVRVSTEPDGKVIRRSFVVAVKPGHVCEACDLPFAGTEELAVHMRCVHSKYACPHCDKNFESYLTLLVHRKFHPVKCVVCGVEFETQRDLVVHRAGCHLPNFECVVCKDTFEDHAKLSDHYRAVHSKFKCNTCSKLSCNKGNSVHHQAQHLTSPSTCLICMSIVQSGQLKRHYLFEHARFQCPVCCLRVGTQTEMTNHAATHVGEHRCETCRAVSDTAAGLESHVATHHRCLHCERLFLTRSEAGCHEKTAHPLHSKEVKPKPGHASHFKEVKPKPGRASHFKKVKPKPGHASHFKEVKPKPGRASHPNEVKPTPGLDIKTELPFSVTLQEVKCSQAESRPARMKFEEVTAANPGLKEEPMGDDGSTDKKPPHIQVGV